MAFPDNSLSSVPVPSEYIGSGGAPVLRSRDFVDGPYAEQDPSRGMDFQQWRAYNRDGYIWVEADNLPARVLLNNPTNSITDISIAFNQNADLHYTWVDAGVAYLRYYDTATSSMQTMTLPAGVRNPRITLDDKRPTQNARSDIVLAYLKADNGLYFRKQRDRFLTEYLLDPGPFLALDQMYMNRGYRLQWRVVAP